MAAGLAAMAMMAMCVSGVVIHRRIFADFFTLRVVSKAQRTTLDLHNLTGVVGLPFNFLISFTGLVILMGTYLPGIQAVLYPGEPAAFAVEAYGTPRASPAKQPADLAPLGAMVGQAQRRWAVAAPATVLVFNPGDRAALVHVHQDTGARVTMDANTVVFDGATGRVVAGPHRYSPTLMTLSYLSGMHYTWFRHTTLRWLYFVSGLAGCALIATGFLFWIQSRAKQHAKAGVRGLALVRGLSVGATAGLVLASLAFLVANRLLPDLPTIAGVPRAWMEVRVFCVVWLLAFANAWLRPHTAWRDQSVAIGVACFAAVLLDWVTTGNVLPLDGAGGRWSAAGVDLVLLCGSALAWIAARRLHARSQIVTRRDPRSAGSKP
ncbi:PepSY-associated TM helix domain-containing protein [Sphingomonas mollis]|uniref:PepSY-associated TM helix domain-containing protein n=1 Tax=Sphingomonas mollis TaxID=2795726 RepID=UPI002FCE6445